MDCLQKFYMTIHFALEGCECFARCDAGFLDGHECLRSRLRQRATRWRQTRLSELLPKGCYEVASTTSELPFLFFWGFVH